MAITRHKQLMGIKAIRITGKEVLDRLGEDKHPDDWGLPEYTVNSNGKLIDTVMYMEDNEVEPTDVLIMLDKHYADELLDEEFSNAGIEECLDKVNLLPVLQKLNIDESPMRLETHRLVIEVVYTCWEDHYSGGSDCDVDINLLGYLNDNMQMVPVNTNVWN